MDEPHLCEPVVIKFQPRPSLRRNGVQSAIGESASAQRICMFPASQRQSLRVRLTHIEEKGTISSRDTKPAARLGINAPRHTSIFSAAWRPMRQVSTSIFTRCRDWEMDFVIAGIGGLARRRVDGVP
jgi:hypothetical protein